MDELENLLYAQQIENKVIILLYKKIKVQDEKICELENSLKVKKAQYLTETEVLEIFKTSRTTLWRLVSNKKLPVYKHGSKNRYRFEDLQDTFNNPQSFQYGGM